MVEKIRLYGDKVLRKKTEEIKEINSEIRQKAQNIIDTLNKNNEFALAAPQIGYSLRMFAIRPIWKVEELPEPNLYINPQLLEFEGTQHEKEGCLSIPEIFEKVKRAEKVKFEAQNIDGEWRKYNADDLFARAIQHEYDHLDGILFIDKINRIKRKFIQGKLNKIKQTTEQGVNIG